MDERRRSASRLFAMDGASAGQRRALQPSVTTSACLHETARLAPRCVRQIALQRRPPHSHLPVEHGHQIQGFSQYLPSTKAHLPTVPGWPASAGPPVSDRVIERPDNHDSPLLGRCLVFVIAPHQPPHGLHSRKGSRPHRVMVVIVTTATKSTRYRHGALTAYT
jgi:hypothetical protein